MLRILSQILGQVARFGPTVRNAPPAASHGEAEVAVARADPEESLAVRHPATRSSQDCLKSCKLAQQFWLKIPIRGETLAHKLDEPAL